MTRLLLAIIALIGLTTPARADDISAAARGVVRVVTIASAEGEVVGFGHGSGLAVAPNRIVTNAHVVELAARYPDNVIIGVVPSEGDRSYRGKLIAYDAQRDLALIEFSGTRLPTLTLFTGPVTDGETVVALGYPGNVDVATAQSAADFIRPLVPVRSQGGFAGRRSLTGIEVLLHTAGIARGSSGGPLLDQCGRVIGVNSAITKAEEGDSSFGFAISDTELVAFLREAKQPFATIGAPCTVVEEKLRQDAAAAARDGEAVAARTRAEQQRAADAREDALDAAQLKADRRRENFIALAGVLLVGGAMAVGAGALFELNRRRRAALASGGAALVLFVASVLVFLNRPFDVVVPATAAAPTASVATSGFGKQLCRLDPARSRINLSSPKDVTIDWGADGCMNGRTQYAENGSKWERILVPDQDQTVSILQFDPPTRSYTESHYLLTASQMAAARKQRDGVKVKACTASEADRLQLAEQQNAVRSTLPARPDEWFVYSCAAAR